MVDPVAGEAVKGERGFQGGGSAAGDQDVRGHAGSSARRAARTSGATAGRECGKPAVRARAAPDGGRARRPYGRHADPCTCSSPAADPPPSRARSPSSAWPASASGSPCSATATTFVYRPARGRRAVRPRRARSASRSRGSPPSAASRCGSARCARSTPTRIACCIADGAPLPYDALLLALGARAEEAIPGALTFRGPEDSRAAARRARAPARRRAAARRVRRRRARRPGRCRSTSSRCSRRAGRPSAGSRSSRGS